MSSDTRDPAAGGAGQADDEEALQEELRREAAEGRDAIGDVASDRTLSGSSTWVTLPDQDADASGGSGRPDGDAPAPRGAP
jgi:hypothetical protein